MNQHNQTLQSIRNGLEIRRKKLNELESEGVRNNETNKRIMQLKKEIRTLEKELDDLL